MNLRKYSPRLLNHVWRASDKDALQLNVASEYSDVGQSMSEGESLWKEALTPLVPFETRCQ